MILNEITEEINNLETEFKYLKEMGCDARKYYDIQKNDFFTTIVPMAILENDKYFIEIK